MSAKSPDYSIILAAGKGTRMNSASIPKVCFEINGVPAVNRAIKVYNNCGISQHILVVGALAGEVIETVGSKFDNTAFVFQRRQNGTADAVKTVLNSMPHIDDDSDILVVAGDRIIEQSVLERLFNLYYTQNCDLAMLTVPRREGSSQGRIVTDSTDAPLAIIEMADIKQRATYKLLHELAQTGKLPGKTKLIELIVATFFGSADNFNEAKAAKAFGKLWQILHDPKSKISATKILELIPENSTYFDFKDSAGKVLRRSPAEVEQANFFNTSVYLVKKSLLKKALKNLRTNNAQQEEYLSDIVAVLAEKDGKKVPVMKILNIGDRTKIMGFNNPAELLEIENNLRNKEVSETTTVMSEKSFRPLIDWRNDLQKIAAGAMPESGLKTTLNEIYSNDQATVNRHLKLYFPLLDHVANKLAPAEKIGLIRSPGRLNVMGRHVDHQGGNCNLMTIGYETLMAVHQREDNMVCLHHVDEENFASVEFSISELVEDLPWDDWLSLVNSDKLAKLISNYGVDWSYYVKASLLRLQKKFTDRRLVGMDIFVTGNIPMAAGLSSSSSLVVGTADAVVAINQLDTFPSQLVTLCGEGEWFVGTRGGSADHAAVKLGERGKVVKVTFFDFAVEDIVEFPHDYVMVVCDSGIKARKSSNAKDQFNHRICCYRIGFMLIKKLFPQFAPLLHHLRDVNVRNLGIPLSWIYRILLHLPEQSTLEELQQMLPEEDLAALCTNHCPPADGLYPIRGVVLFGLSEFERSRLYADCLKNGDLKTIGQLMNSSHDGDRVSINIDGKQQPYQAPTSNLHLLKLMEDLDSGAPERVIAAQLQWQPGSYHCSIPEIDKMVDLAITTPGVVGAQLAGAGLGGCMMVLAHIDCVDDLRKNICEKYYAPAKIKPNILICRPISGAGIITLPE
ncbi:MAG: NTP transferase domain-containing protein [Victivallaceae bacterium]|nr:NTP transferase domain-containing protein [Victivallaceae bacterium]